MSKALILLTFVLICSMANATTLWDVWFTDPFYSNPNWTYPAPPAGYSRIKATSPFEESLFGFDRSLQYVWTNGAKEYYCGPKTYLNSNFHCVKHPLFWQTVQTEYCAPLENRSKFGTCFSSFNGKIIPCCYESSNNQFCHEKSLDCSTQFIDNDVKYH